MDASALPEDAIPTLAPNANLAGLSLGPTEGFLLSRIDGTTNIRGICALSHLGEGQTKQILLTLARSGVLQLKDKAGAVLDLGAAASGAQIDPNLELRITQVLRGEQVGDPYAVLFIDRETDLRTIKKSYYTLTQALHPDNYYGVDLGSWKDKLEHAFAAITKAYEQLSDPELRAEIDRRLKFLEDEDTSTRSQAPGSSPETEHERTARIQASRKQSALYQAVREKIEKARELAEAAEKALYSHDFMSAYNNYKMALTYDPRNDVYKRNVEMLGSKVGKIRAANTFKRAQQLLDAQDEDAAIALLRQVVEQDRSHAVARYELARLLLPRMNRGGPTAKQEVFELAESAAILDAEKPEHLLLAGRVAQMLGEAERARELYKSVLKIDKKNEFAKQALKEL